MPWDITLKSSESIPCSLMTFSSTPPSLAWAINLGVRICAANSLLFAGASHQSAVPDLALAWAIISLLNGFSMAIWTPLMDSWRKLGCYRYMSLQCCNSEFSMSHDSLRRPPTRSSSFYPFSLSATISPSRLLSSFCPLPDPTAT